MPQYLKSNVSCPPVLVSNTEATIDMAQLTPRSHRQYKLFQWNAAFALQHCIAEAVAVRSVMHMLDLTVFVDSLTDPDDAAYHFAQ
jgi:hypothetical protein